MDLIVAHDLTTHGDAALRAAIVLADRDGAASIGVVHIITQQALDQTGALTAAEKQQAAVEKMYPTLWRRIEDVTDERDGGSAGLDLDVLVRTAPVHLVRSQARIAEILLEVARDLSAPRIVLGRRGRPDGVADHMLRHGEPDPVPAGAPEHVLVLRVASAG